MRYTYVCVGCGFVSTEFREFVIIDGEEYCVECSRNRVDDSSEGSGQDEE